MYSISIHHPSNILDTSSYLRGTTWLLWQTGIASSIPDSRCIHTYELWIRYWNGYYSDERVVLRESCGVPLSRHHRLYPLKGIRKRKNEAGGGW